VARDGTVRRLEENEFVWGWERNNPDVETQLVFKQLIGLLNFAIGYPETSVLVGQPVEVRVKVRDPDSGNQLVNNHRGELALFVCPASEGDDDGDSEEGMDEEQVVKVLAQKAEQDGVFSMHFTPPDAGCFQMMMHGFPLQDRVYKLHVVTKKKTKGLPFGKPKIKRHDSSAHQSSSSSSGGGDPRKEGRQEEEGELVHEIAMIIFFLFFFCLFCFVDLFCVSVLVFFVLYDMF